jgi:hypothetical protein
MRTCYASVVWQFSGQESHTSVTYLHCRFKREILVLGLIAARFRRLSVGYPEASIVSIAHAAATAHSLTSARSFWCVLPAKCSGCAELRLRKRCESQEARESQEVQTTCSEPHEV